MQIREAVETDLDDVLSTQRLAFGYDKEANLVRELLHDPSAKPLLPLLAFEKDRAVGHILFTKARLSGAHDKVSMVILAPLAITPDAQKQGIGGKLIERGLELLSKSGVDLVFVLGHPIRERTAMVQGLGSSAGGGRRRKDFGQFRAPCAPGVNATPWWCCRFCLVFSTRVRRPVR